MLIISAVLIVSVILAWILFDLYKPKIKYFFKAHRLKKLKLNKSDLKNSMHETESHFYHEGFISKDEFKRKMKNHKRKLASLKRKEKEILKESRKD